MERSVLLFQKLESATILIALVVVYFHLHFSWLTFAIFILLPDTFMIGYLKNPRIGAIIYNLGHIYFTPLLILGASLWLHSNFGIALAIIWTIHIALDRTIGFGLKLPTGFNDITHSS